MRYDDYHYFVYILASQENGTLYVGVTNDLARRVREHREGGGTGFTRKHGVTRLVWWEEHQFIKDAIARKKSIKRWRRNWKVALIEEANVRWDDLAGPLLDDG